MYAIRIGRYINELFNSLRVNNIISRMCTNRQGKEAVFMNDYFSTNMFNNIHESCAVLDKINRIMSTKGYSYVFKHVMTFTSLMVGLFSLPV